MSENNKSKSGANVEKQLVDGMQVRTYTLKEGQDTLFKVMSEAEIEQAERDYDKKLQEEADRKFKEKNREMEQKLMGELAEENFDASAIPMEGAADSIAIDTEYIEEHLKKINKDDRIACIGDSITYGAQVEGSQTWIGRLRREEKINLLNLGIDGDTTGNMLARFHEHVIDLNAKAVLIMGGGNDIMGQTPVEYVNNNIAMMTQMALDKGIVPIIGMVPEPDHKNVPEEWKVVIDYNACRENLLIYKEWLLVFAKANCLPYIDFDSGMKSRLRAGYGRYFFDGLHPNPAGHKIMAAIAKDAFIEMGILKKGSDKIDEKFSL